MRAGRGCDSFRPMILDTWLERQGEYRDLSASAPARPCVAIAARNEAALVGACLTAVAASFAGSGHAPMAALFVNNSTDDTAARVLELARQRPWLRLLSHPRSGGQSAGVHNGAIAARIRRLAEETKIPVHAFVEDVAASGGYWLATAADTIFSMLMGDQVAPRRDFIETHAKEVKFLDV